MENELQRAANLGILDRLSDDLDFGDDFKDGFPHNRMPIFARNEQIRHDLNSRQGKCRIKAKQDHKTWSQWNKQRTALVGEYNESTQVAQRLKTDYRITEYQPATQSPNARDYKYPPPRTRYKSVMMSIKGNTKEKTHHGVALATGIELLYSANIWFADTGASCHITNRMVVEQS